ncbi:MAG TPA: GAF domain-containing protein [Candidatus Binatia bacterium]
MGLSDRMAEALQESYQGLERKITERTRDLSALYAALAPLASADPTRLLQQIVERLKEATGADAALIRILDKETKSLRSPAHVGFSSAYLQSTQDLDEGSAVRAAFTSGEPIIAADISKDSRLKGKKQIEAGFRSCAFLPLKVSGELRGVVHLASGKAGHFSADKMDNLMAIARQMGVAMENRELLEETKRRAEQQEALVKSLSLLIGASQKLVARVDIDTLAQDILTTVVTSFGIRLAWIGSAESDGRVRPLYWAGDVAEYLRHVEIRWDDSPLGQGPAGRAIRTGRPVVMDVATDPGFEPWRKPALDHGYREVAAFPLMRGATPFGHLILYSSQNGFFTSERVELLQTYANIATGALESARLFEETKRQAQEKAALNTIATAVSQSLDVQQILNIAIEKVLEVTGRERGYIRLKDLVTGEVTLAAHKGISEEYANVLIHQRTPGGKTDQVFTTGKPVIINDPTAIPLKGETRREGQNVVAWIPVKARGEVIGILNVASARLVPFSTQEVELLQSIGNVIGVALENAWLYKESQQHHDIQKLLKEVSQDVTVLGLDRSLTKIADKVREMFKVDIADFRIIEAGAAKYIGRSGQWSELLVGSGKMRGRMKWILEHRTPLIIPDINVETNLPSGDSIRHLGLRGFLAVPLLSRSAEVIGVLRALTYLPRDFRPEQVDFLQQLANGVAIAIENARLFEETVQRAQEQAALSAIATATSQSLHIDEMLHLALDKVLEVTGREKGYIRLKDPLTGDVKLAAHRGISDKYVTLLQRRTPGGKSDQVFETGEPVIINAPEKALLREETRDEGNSSIAWIPLKAHGKVVGILNVSTAQSGFFTSREVDLLQAIGNVIGVAVENGWLYQESQRQEEIQKLLKELSQDITSLDIKSFFQKVTDKVREYFKVDISDIRLIEQGGILPPVGLSGADSKPLYKLGGLRGRAGWIVKNRRAAVISDTSKDTTIPAGDTTREIGIRGYLAVPLFARSGEVIGILRALTYKPREFSQSEVDLVQQLANGTAIALTNARLFEETERRAREQAALYGVTAAVSGSFDIEQILLKGLDAVLEATGMEGGYIQFLDGNPPKLVLRAHRGMSQTFIAKTRDEIRPGGKTQQIIATKQPLVLEDIAPDHGKFQGENITAAAWVPIVAKDKVIAVLAVSTKTKRHFPQAQLPLLVSIANALGVALENARLFQETERNLERIRALREIDQAISSTLDLRNVLDVLLEKIDLSLPYATATIRLFNKENGMLEPVACRNLDENEWKLEQWKPGRGIANVVFETKTPLIIPNAQADPRVLDAEFYRKHRLTSYVGVPLIVKEEALGVLGFYTKEEHDFTGEEVDFLATLAGQAAIAIHNSQLYENARLREKQLEETNRMLSALHAVAATASQSLDLDRVFQSAIGKITDIFGFDATHIHIYNERTDELALRASFESDPNRFVPVQSFQRGQGIVGEVAESGRSMIFEDVQTDPTYQKLSRSKTSGCAGYHLFAVFPIKGKLRNLGTLACTGIDPRKLTPGEIQLLEAVADQVAVAIENGQLYEQLRQKVEELMQANKVKDEFLSVMSHELRTPLNVVMGYAAMIKDEMLGVVNLEQKRALEKVISRSSDLLNMITSILYATSIEAKEVRVQNSEFGLSDLLDELKRIYDISLLKPIALDWDYAPGLPQVFLDRDKARVVLQKLIDNATKFTETGGVTVTARLSEGRKQNPENSRREAPLPEPANGWLFLEPPWLEVKVTDTGVGIAKDKLPVIFDKFRQADSSETRRYGGVGLGLYIAKHFTELLGGHIEVETEEGKGSIFTLKVPCPILPSSASSKSENIELTGHVSQIH